MRNAFYIFALVVITSTSGCAMNSRYVTGLDFDEQKQTQIVKNQSTKDDLRKLFGHPNEVDLTSEGREKWTYIYEESKAQTNIWITNVKGETRTKKLIVLFNENNVVQNYVYSDTTTPSDQTF